jgi:hypothetical protein
MNDELLISGKFLEEDVLPKNRRWLYRYFDTDVQKQFVRYYLTFGRVDRFTDHTGHHISDRWTRKLVERVKRLESAHVQARADTDIEKVAQLESGQYPL